MGLSYSSLYETLEEILFTNREIISNDDIIEDIENEDDIYLVETQYPDALPKQLYFTKQETSKDHIDTLVSKHIIDCNHSLSEHTIDRYKTKSKLYVVDVSHMHSNLLTARPVLVQSYSVIRVHKGEEKEASE